MGDASSHVKSAPATTRPAAQITEKATDRSSSFDRPTKASSDTAVGRGVAARPAAATAGARAALPWGAALGVAVGVDDGDALGDADGDADGVDDSAAEATRRRPTSRRRPVPRAPAAVRSAVPGDEAAQKHTSAPFVYSEEGGATTFVGGCSAAVDWRARRGGAAASSMVDDGFREHGFDYDVVVVGGGSGGLACSKECAKLGAKVAVLDFVKPSPAGSTWGLGGTCVNVGCIPKKLMHTASIIGETLKDDAAAFGWKDAAAGAHDWESMKSTVQDHIKSLNFKYRVALREAGITYLNRLGEFEDKNTISLTDKKGNKTDDLFSLPKAPGRVLCVGGGYIALSRLHGGMGYPTACMVRSILLRGFDRECVGKIEAHIKHHGVQLQAKKLECVDEQLPGARVAIGDVVEGRPELTPVAIEAGLRLARRLFGGKTEPMDYERAASAATAAAKLVVDKSTGKVVGFHYLGPNAGEITQGFSIAMRKGATYADFISTVGIHPAVAEEFTSMTVTKSSGESAAKGGC
ncbi:thioredoxin-disulfide reductase [Aureococcus anophagefferens]|nr:thioredoxin-disulfide reductase [Aureococcus anophagefferens]